MEGSYNYYIIALSAIISLVVFLLFGVTITIFIILSVSWLAMFLKRRALERMAYQDNVTGLYNRNEMHRYFDSHVGDQSIGVLFLDLDQFKSINDTMGHHIGDLLIGEVGNRLRKFVHGNQQAFRIGGDEFLIIIEKCDQEKAELIAREVLNSIKNAYYIDGNELYVTGSIGISTGTIHSSEHLRLFTTADSAMYRAKRLGKNQYCVYNAEIGEQEVRKMEIEKDLHLALEINQFIMEYQPKWNVRTNSLCGFEALIRWDHPRLGIVSPLEFIPIAEESGFIIPLTRWILKEATHQCKSWQNNGIIQPVSVNLSIRFFQTNSLLDEVTEVLGKAMLDPHFLELEITESVMLYDINDIIRQLESVRSIGVRVSMDDFGSGYSSIGLLDRIPVDALKLDRLFTNDLETPSKRAIIHAIIMMANNLQLEVIAEGVEKQEHIEILAHLGCEIMQGFYYGKPMRIEKLYEWIKHHSYVAKSY